MLQWFLIANAQYDMRWEDHASKFGAHERSKGVDTRSRAILPCKEYLITLFSELLFQPWRLRMAGAS